MYVQNNHNNYNNHHHHYTRARDGVLQGRLCKSMGEPEIRPPRLPPYKSGCSNRSSPTFEWVTMAPYPIQNFTKIRLRVFNPYIGEIVDSRYLLGFYFILCVAVVNKAEDVVMLKMRLTAGSSV